MARMSKILRTSALFLLAGGWGYNGSAAWAKDDTVAALDSAVAQAVAATAPAIPNALPATMPAEADAAPPTTMPAVAPVAATAPAPTDAAAATSPAVDGTIAASDQPLSAPTVNVGADGLVEQFNAQDLDINTALHFLSLQSHKNIIASKEVKGSVTANLYNVTFTEALDALLKPNGFDYVEKGNFIYVYTDKEIEDIKKRDHKMISKVFRLRYINATDASTLIKPLMSTSGQVALTPAALAGIPEGSSDTGGNAYATDDTLVINDYPENLDDVNKALGVIDVRPKQVLLESTILRATLQNDNDLGVDLVSLSGLDFSTLTSIAATNNTGVTTPGSLSGTTIANDKAQANIGTNFANQIPDGGLSVGFLSNNVALFLKALEQVTNTTVVANPKVLALNKHRGEVFIGNHNGYQTTTTTQTTTQETISYLDTGTKLLFRPFIGDDGYVRLEIHPEDSSGAVQNGLPNSQSTEVTSNIMVKDGRTVVIGGLFREQTTSSRGQVPIIGDIPVLGLPFRQTSDDTQRTETIFLLTPHIINDDTALYNESEKKAEDVTRYMIGARKGLQPWGRERIAQLWYSKAVEAKAKGDNKKAEMYTDWATNCNPMFIEAIKMHEDLTNKKLTEATTSSITGFVRDVVEHDDSPTNFGGAHYEMIPPGAHAIQPPSLATPATMVPTTMP
jgi:type IV pilus assembly protein PilQ